METKFSNLEPQMEGSGIALESEAEPLLKESAKWSKVLSIMGFIGIGLMIIFGIFSFFLGGMAAFSLSPSLAMMQGTVMGFVYLLLAVLYFFPNYYLYKFANETAKAFNNRDTHTLTQGFKNLKSFLSLWEL